MVLTGLVNTHPRPVSNSSRKPTWTVRAFTTLPPSVALLTVSYSGPPDRDSGHGQVLIKPWPSALPHESSPERCPAVRPRRRGGRTTSAGLGGREKIPRHSGKVGVPSTRVIDGNRGDHGRFLDRVFIECKDLVLRGNIPESYERRRLLTKPERGLKV